MLQRAHALAPGDPRRNEVSMIEQPVEIEVRMPRYVIERDFGLVGEEEMQEVAAPRRPPGSSSSQT